MCRWQWNCQLHLCSHEGLIRKLFLHFTNLNRRTVRSVTFALRRMGDVTTCRWVIDILVNLLHYFLNLHPLHLNCLQCYNCKHDFCWMCLGDWRSHGSEYYECSRYKVSALLHTLNSWKESSTNLRAIFCIIHTLKALNVLLMSNNRKMLYLLLTTFLPDTFFLTGESKHSKWVCTRASQGSAQKIPALLREGEKHIWWRWHQYWKIIQDIKI